jgi:group II intron reverse transcriptase/maturase
MMQTSIHVIAQAAQRDKSKSFRSLYSFLNRVTLAQAYHGLNKDAAPGVDRVTWESYGKNLEQNLIDLETRLKNKRYFAHVVRRVTIPKENGKTRPLGIPALEDKLVQYVVRDLLEALFEPLFYKHSYAYRPHKSARQAVEEARSQLMGKYRLVIEVDIQSFFDSINHDWLIKMIEVRVNDSSITGLIRQWLKAGIKYDDGHVENPEQGTPQGGVISPILANIYLHYVLDNWFQTAVKLECSMEATLVRYADDFVVAFRSEKDANWFFSELPGRFAKFGLTLSEDKTRKIRFTRFDKDGSGTFDFLGFNFRWGVSRKGHDVVLTRTSGKKIHKTINEFAKWIKENRNKPVRWIMQRVKSKLLGQKNYFGIQGNSERVWQIMRAYERLLYKWLNRRSQRRSYSWGAFREMISFYNVWLSARIGNNGVQMSFMSLLF